MTGEDSNPQPETMQAWTQDRYGDASAVQRQEVAVPTPKPNQLLVRPRVVAVNSPDARLMAGDPTIVRLAFGLRRPRVRTRGMDIAGTVVAVGADATGFAVGDEIVVESPGGGGFAEYAVVPAARAVLRPSSVSAADASTLPIAAGTAVQGLDLAGVGAGSHVLILGASGGVGTFLVQLAVLRGATITTVSARANVDAMRALGADEAYAREDVGAQLDGLARGYDAVMDVTGLATLRRLRSMLAPDGTVVLIAGGSRVLGPLARIVRSLFVTRKRARVRPLAAVAKPDVLRQLLAAVAEGRLIPQIERAYTFDEVPAALAHQATSTVRGKVVVTR